MIDWSDLHLFLSVVRAGSLRAAARELRLDVSTVSRRLTQLEQTAGDRLLLRGARKLELTAAGAHVLASAERMSLEVSALSRKVAHADRRVAGLVRVTTPGSLSHLAVEAFRDLSAAHSGLELELWTHDALSAIDGAQLDVALRIAEAPPEHLVGQRVARLRAGIYATRAYLKAHPEPLEAPGHAWVEWDRRLMQKPAFQWTHQTFIERRIVARGLTTFDVHALVRSGLGVGALPRVVADGDPQLQRLCAVPDELASSVWLLTHPDLRDVPRIRSVLSALRRSVTRHKLAL